LIANGLNNFFPNELKEIMVAKNKKIIIFHNFLALSNEIRKKDKTTSNFDIF